MAASFNQNLIISITALRQLNFLHLLPLFRDCFLCLLFEVWDYTLNLTTTPFTVNFNYCFYPLCLYQLRLMFVCSLQFASSSRRFLISSFVWYCNIFLRFSLSIYPTELRCQPLLSGNEGSIFLLGVCYLIIIFLSKSWASFI